MTNASNTESLSPIPLINAHVLVNALLPRMGEGDLAPNGIRSASLGEVDGHSIEFSIGREVEWFPDHLTDQDSPDALVALVGSLNHDDDPVLWFQFNQSDTGDTFGFQLHEKFGDVEYDADYLFEIWGDRLATLAEKYAGFAAPKNGVITDHNSPKH